MRYFKPKSLSWWSGIGLIGLGVATMFMPDNYTLTEFGTTLTMLSGGTDASPGVMVATGLGIIGLRDKLERG